MKNSLKYVSSVPESLKSWYEEHYHGDTDVEAIAMGRLLSYDVMCDAYPTLIHMLGNDQDKDCFRLGLWLQMAASRNALLTDTLRAQRAIARDWTEEARIHALRLATLIERAEEEPEFLPSALDIGSLIEGAFEDFRIDSRLRIPLGSMDDTRDVLRQLHIGDDRYFPTLLQLLHVFAGRCEAALEDGTNNFSDMDAINAALDSRKSTRHTSYLRHFQKEWEKAATYSGFPKKLPSYEVLAAQAVAALDLGPEINLDADMVRKALKAG